MRFLYKSVIKICLIWLCAFSANAENNTVHLAVSPSIQYPIENICDLFSQKTSYRCKITTAPTGHLYAHIMHGLSYDLLVSADDIYKQGLINAGKAEPSGHFVFATGRIVLWSADPDATPDSLRHALTSQSVAVAMANPGLTPYGGAAKEILQGYQLWNQIQKRLIYGKNLQQTYEIVASHRAPVGFISLAQLSPTARLAKHYWEPDPNSYKPVMHEVIILKAMQHQHQTATAAFVTFLRQQDACQIINNAGFRCSAETQINA